MKDLRPKLLDLAALAAIALAILSPSVWARIYYRNNSIGFMLAGFALLFAVLATVSTLLDQLGTKQAGSRFLRACTVGAVVLAAGIFATGGSLAASPLRWLLPVAAVAAVLGGLGRRLVPAWWPRLRLAATIGGVLFFASAPLLGAIASHAETLLPPAGRERVPTVWLLLDETSFGAAEEIALPLRRLGLWTAVAELEPAGRNTLDVIPSIVRRRPMGLSTGPCGPSTVCASTGAVDFSRVDVGRPGVDLVGIHHPYCEIQGWRSCTDNRGASPDWGEQWRALGCAPIFRSRDRAATCERTQARDALAMRDRLQAAVLAAPFWREGGDLYAHLPLPHMPASVEPQPSLAAAYALNIGLAANFVDSLASRLMQRFPQGFRLVIFADHPLRPVAECGIAYSNDCSRPTRYAVPYRVPLIVAAPQAQVFTAPSSNLRILDLFAAP